jgi:Tfp pilus assembly protein PilO
MKAREARLRFIGMMVLAAASGALFYLLSYVPQNDALHEKEAEAAALRREIESAAAFRRSHPAPEKEAKTVAERKRAVETMLPARLDMGTFLLEMEKRAAESGVTLLGVAPGEPGASEGFATEKLRLSVRGDYFAMLDYLYALEQQGRFVKIDAMRGNVEGGVFKGEIELWIYARAL